jgi:hypothetical protein
MDFDWADETIHASYGKHWLRELLAARGEDPASHDQIRERCKQLVRDYVATATQEEVSSIREIAGLLLKQATHKLANRLA